jgi:two-component system sensor histidine kinase UhpB
MALGHVPLAEILSELVRERARQHPQIAFAFSPGTLERSYGDSVDLTLYRCVQESLTNAIRHAQAERVDIELGEADRDALMHLMVRDDGQGIDPDAPPGFGLIGMQERVQALGGDYRVEGAAGRGTCVRITIPLRPIADATGAAAS